MIFDVDERTSRYYTAQLVDQFGAPVLPEHLHALELTIANVLDGAIVNGRDHALAAGLGVGIAYDGERTWITWPMAAADNVVLDPRQPYELHLAQFDFTSGVGDVGRHLVHIRVRNLGLVQ